MYRYRITLEALDSDASPEQLAFEVENHDNITAIASRLPSRFGLDEDSTKAVVVGFKFLSEIVLKHRDQPPFRELRPSLRDFEQSLKRHA